MTNLRYTISALFGNVTGHESRTTLLWCVRAVDRWLFKRVNTTPAPHHKLMRIILSCTPFFIFELKERPFLNLFQK
jgi:hypothetical protein